MSVTRSTPLRILHLEDVSADAELAERELARAGIDFEIRRVETREAFLAALSGTAPDLILSDYRLPAFDGMQALLLAKEHFPDIPFIITTGSVNEETAVACMRAGAADYVLKDHLGRLGTAVRSALERHRLEAERRRAESRVRQLNRLLKTISEINELIVRADEKSTLLSETCRILVGRGGFRMAWVGFADVVSGLVVVEAKGGERTDYLEGLVVRFDEAPEGRGPVGTAIRTGEHSVIGDVATDPAVAPWRERMLAYGFGTIASFPVRSRGALSGALTVYASAAFEIGEEETRLLGNLSGDLGYALETLEIREESLRAEQALRESEERFKSLYENALMGLYRTAPDGTVQLANPCLCRMLGYDSLEEVKKRNLEEEGFEPSYPRSEFKRKLDEEGVVIGLESRWRRRDGRFAFVRESATAIRDGSGKVLYYEGTVEDITERKIAEEALRGSQKTLRALFDSNPDATLLLRRDGTVISCNLAVATEFGKSVREIVGHSIFELMPADVAAARRERLDEVFATNRIVRKREEVGDRIEDVMLVPIEGEDGKVAQVAVFVRDETELERAREDLGKSELYFRSLIEYAIDITAVLGPGGEVRYASPSVERILGYRPADLVGTRVFDLVHPENQPDMLSRFRRVQEDGTRFESFEGRVRHVDGSWRILSVIGRALSPETGMQGVILNARDVTDRLKAEEELRKFERAVEQSPASVVITDVEGRIEYVNRKFTEITGYTLDESRGQNPRILKTERTPRSAHEELWRTISTGGTWQGEFCNKKKSGELFWELASISPIRGPDGTISHFVAVKEDISEKKRSAEALAEVQRELVQAQKMEAIGRLAGGVAHDFNNLLTVIQGYGEILRRGVEPGDPRSEALEEILTAAGRAATLTRQLLVFSRKQITEPRLVRLDAIVNDMAKMLRRLIGEDVEMTVLTEPGLPQVRTDPSQAEQVLMNLAVNARDAMPTGGNLTVLVEAERLSAPLEGFPEKVPPGDWVVLSVADSGTGMSAETLSHIFEPFFTTKEVGKGTGLGLATVWGIVKQNGGFVQASSLPGAGATFRIYFPKSEGTRPISGVRAAVKRGGSETILLVEDEPAVRNLTRNLLQASGYRVLPASGPSEAVAIAERPEERIDLLLTDVVMPEMTGPVLAKKIRTSRPGLKVLFMSGYSTDVLQDLSDFETSITPLSKPFTRATLEQKVREALDESAPSPE